MISVPATEFSKHFGRYRDISQHEPVEVTSHERVSGYFLSRREYEEYVLLKEARGKAYAVWELSGDTLEAIATTHMHKRHDKLNALME